MNAPLRAAAITADPRWARVLARDPAADGCFFYSVRSTGVYCRPSCGARTPRPENVAFHASADEAEAAGFRPCRRCKPDQPPLAAQHAACIAGLPVHIQPTVASDLDLMNLIPPQSSASLPETDSASATTDPARTALLDALNELLEAERAGARVAMETGRSITDPELAALVEDIHKDEVRWCSMLMRTIRAMEGTPSSATGAFWGKAMAIPDLEQRLDFLYRGQTWVVRRLETLIPRIEDAQVRADLSIMLEAHRGNIERIDARHA